MLWLTTAMAGETAVNPQPVRLGIDRIDEYLYLFKDKRVGLITNQTGVNSRLQSTIDILKQKANLVALFSPEHGIRGAAGAGAKVESGIDRKTGLPVFSLYGSTRKSTPEMLADIDVLCFDIQDTGARFYTYISTMAYAMESCRDQDKTFVVFDRPNPISGEAVEGPVLKPGFESFIGLYPIPVRHGMTVGELARMFNDEFGIGSKLEVVPMSGWQRRMYWEDTGLPWIMTSPNIPTTDTTVVYPGTGIFGATNISEGVGTTKPFELVGAAWLDPGELADRLNALAMPGIFFRPTSFTPRFGAHTGVNQGGVQLHITDKRAYRAVYTAAAMLSVIREMSGDTFEIKKDGMFELSLGERSLREQQESWRDLTARWEREAEDFKRIAHKYYLYQ
jgi:uncharacterized protein YbbC (DUF1343 family)